MLRPSLTFETSASSGSETSDATLSIQLNFIPKTSKTVDFSCLSGTDLASQPDYINNFGTISFAVDNSSTPLTINIVNDLLVESSEYFDIVLSNPSIGLNIGPIALHQYTIQDDDNPRKIYFDIATTTILEDNVQINIDVSINNHDLTNPTTVDFALTGGSASNGTDYTATAGTLNIAPSGSTGSITLSILEDILFEINGTIQLSLSNPSNCNLDGQLPFGRIGILLHTVLINDDDLAPTLEFATSTNSGLESNSVVNIPVQIDQVSAQNTTVQYTVRRTATNGLDFVLANGTVTINSGALSSTIPLIITDDVAEELSETIIVDLVNPQNALLGTLSQFTYTLLDKDIFGHNGPGGVGNSNNKVLWIKSTDLNSLSDGSTISIWPDASGNNHDLTQGVAAFCPRYYSGIVHGQPVVRFEQANNRLIRSAFTAFPSNQITSIIVNRNNETVTTDCCPMLYPLATMNTYGITAVSCPSSVHKVRIQIQRLMAITGIFCNIIGAVIMGSPILSKRITNRLKYPCIGHSYPIGWLLSSSR